MERILAQEYVPTELDVLRSREYTTGVIKTSFRVGKLTYRCVHACVHVCMLEMH